MGRVKWKGPFIGEKKQGNLLEVKRNSVITNELLGKTLWCHNGKNLGKIEVTEDMVGFKVGAFVLTRSEFTFKKKKKK